MRETSSWDVPSSLSSRARTVLDCNFLDAECGIGDRPGLAVNQIGLYIWKCILFIARIVKLIAIYYNCDSHTGMSSSIYNEFK